MGDALPDEGNALEEVELGEGYLLAASSTKGVGGKEGD